MVGTYRYELRKDLPGGRLAPLQVVSAISYLHNLNLMHRDIKPENVMFTHPVEAFEAEGKPLRVKVIDMGMSALFDPNKVGIVLRGRSPGQAAVFSPTFVS